MLKLWYTYVLFGLLWQPVSAQSAGKVCHIGEKFPNYVFTSSQQGGVKKFTLAQFEGKAVLIDIWDIHCSSCIMGMKKLDSIQQLFRDDLQIILVTKNSLQEVKKTLTRAGVKLPDLPLVVKDTILYEQLFPHSGDPVHVWIDKDRIIRHIAGGFNTSAENLKRFLNHEALSFAVKSAIKDFDRSKPLIKSLAGPIQSYIVGYSVFSREMSNVLTSSSIEVQRETNVVFPYAIKMIDASRYDMVQLAYNYSLYGLEINTFQLQRNNRIELTSPRAKSMVMPKTTGSMENWFEQNWLCYELLMPRNKIDQIWTWMQQDVQRFLDLDIVVKEAYRNCLVLVDNKHISDTAIGKQVFNYTGRENMAMLIRELICRTQNEGLPFLDGTDHQGNLSITIPEDLTSIEDLNGYLKSFGLQLIIRKDWVKMVGIN